MSANRFFLPSDAFQGDIITFPPDQAHQVRRVLRLQKGDEVVALDGSGREFNIKLSDVSSAVVGSILTVSDPAVEPGSHVTLCQALLKGDRFELVLQKATELGVSRFIPLVTERVVARTPGSSRSRRWEAVVREAAEQSGRTKLPVVEDPMKIEAAVEAVKAEHLLFAWEEHRGQSLATLTLPPSTKVSLCVGPEGGFSKEEARMASERGARIVTLGRRVLRAETAAIAGVTLVMRALRELEADGETIDPPLD